jgi:anti-sigma factor RsiW
MQCEEARNQFTDYLGDELDEQRRSEFENHLIACQACRDEAEALKGIWMKLDMIAAETPASAAMRARFDVMVEAYRHGMDHAPRRLWWSRLNGWFSKWWPQQPALQFGMTVALLAVGVLAGRYASPAAPVAAPTAEQTTQIVQLRDELHDMRQMVAISLMQQQSASERLKGVSWSNQIDRPDTEVLNTLLDTLLHDANINVRLAAIDALKKFGERQIVRSGVLTALTQQESPMVQAALIDFMVETHDKESVPALQQIANDAAANDIVRKRAEWGLEQLQ